MAVLLSSYLDGVGWLPKGEYLYRDVALAYGLSQEALGRRIATLMRQGLWKYEPNYVKDRSGVRYRFFRTHELGELDRLCKGIRFDPTRIPDPEEAIEAQADTGHFDQRYEGAFHRLDLLRRFADYGYIPSEALEWIAHTSRLHLNRVWLQQERVRPDEGLRILGWRVSPFQELNGEFWWEIRPDELPYEHRLRTVPLRQSAVEEPDLDVEPPSDFETVMRERALTWLRQAGPIKGLSTLDLSRRLSTPMPAVIDLLTGLLSDGAVIAETDKEEDDSSRRWFAVWEPEPTP